MKNTFIFSMFLLALLGFTSAQQGWNQNQGLFHGDESKNIVVAEEVTKGNGNGNKS